MTTWWKRFQDLTSRGTTPSRLRVAAQDSGIAIEEDSKLGDSIILPWKEVTRVIAYRRDAYVGDLICLAVELDRSRTVELDETMRGWHEFLAALPCYLTGAKRAEETFVSLVAKPHKDEPVLVFARKEIEA